jgi:hypothetical protein
MSKVVPAGSPTAGRQKTLNDHAEHDSAERWGVKGAACSLRCTFGRWSGVGYCVIFGDRRLEISFRSASPGISSAALNEASSRQTEPLPGEGRLLKPNA